MLNTIYEGKNRNDETQTPVTHVIGHNHHNKKTVYTIANTQSYVSDGKYRENNSDRNANKENIPNIIIVVNHVIIPKNAIVIIINKQTIEIIKLLCKTGTLPLTVVILVCHKVNLNQIDMH